MINANKKEKFNQILNIKVKTLMDFIEEILFIKKKVY